MERHGLAHRMGRWSATHRRTAIFGWIAFVLVAMALGGAVGTKTLEGADSAVGESQRAERILEDAAFEEGAAEQVLIQAREGRLGESELRAAVSDLRTELGRLDSVADVEVPADNPNQLSADGRSALVNFTVRGDTEKTADEIESVLDATAAVAERHPQLRVEQFGEASAEKALEDTLGEDFQQAELLSLPITLVILVLAFGALAAAGIPLLLALSAVAGSLGLVGLVSQLLPVSDAVSSVVLLIGLAVGVDYSLFYIRREREERARGAGKAAALEAAAATSGRAVLVSGFTVMIAMAGLYLGGNSEFRSMATGMILVVAVAMLGSLTVLPAVLSKLGDRVEKGRVPFLGRRRSTAAESRAWGAVLRRVMRRPAVAVVLAGGALTALALPALGMDTKLNGVTDLPRDIEAMQIYDRIEAAFPGAPVPALVAFETGDVNDPQVQEAIADLRREALATGHMQEPISVEVDERGEAAEISIPLTGSGTDETSNAALAELREEIVPNTVGQVGDAAVTGLTAATEDFGESVTSNAPIVIAFVLAMAFLLLLVTFRSIVVPITAILLNLLSVAAAYGLLVLVFQEGVGLGLVGLEETGPVVAWLPMMLFVILFGLSMDYHVFILSRIREAVDRGMSTGDAVSHGIRSSASTVTAAAVVMVGVFAVFVTLTTVDMKQMGVGLAAAILIDATVIRGVLLPATMKLLGDHNWYLPRWLDWLPRVRAELPPAAREPQPATA